MSEGTNADLDSCPETHEIFRFCVKKGKAKKKKLNFNLSNFVKELGPGNKDWFENATAQKIQQKKQKHEDFSAPLCTPKDKIHSNQLCTSTSTSSESSDNKFYSKIQRLLTSQTSTPSQTAGWQVPVLGASPDVVYGSAPLCKQMDIRRSLGVDMNDSMLSWTSSMATPTLMDSTFKGSPSPVTKQQKGLPRVLFSPGPSQTDEELHALDHTSEDNTDDDEPPSVPSTVRDSRPTVGTLVSSDVTVFQNINQQEVFNTDSELSENFPKTESEDKLNTKSQSSPNFRKKPFKGSTSVDANVDEESSMPLFSQDLYMDDEIDGDQEQVYSTEIMGGTPHALQGNNKSPNTGGGGEIGVSEALSDFFDPPSSAVGRRRCAPRKGKKRKLLDDSLSLEVGSDHDVSPTSNQSKKMKTVLLYREDRKEEQNKTALQKEKEKAKQENKIAFKSENVEEDTYSTSLKIHQRKHSLSVCQEDVSWGNCSTPNNAQKVLKSILSSKKKSTEGSAVLSNKKVRFSVEEKSVLKRNLTQLDDEDYVSPEVFVETMGDTPSGKDSGSDRHTVTLAILEGDSVQNDLMSENAHTEKSPRKDLDICDELFSQVSPRALNEMCFVATSVDKSNTTQKSNLETGSGKTHKSNLETGSGKTQKSNLETGSDKTKPNIKLTAEDKPVLVKTEEKQCVTLPAIKTEDEHKVTLPVGKKEDSITRYVPSNPSPSMVSGVASNSLRSSISLKAKPRKFLYPSTNQISKSCPKSVYGFAEQSEKNMRMTMNAKIPVSKDTPPDTVLVQQSSTKSGLGEKSVDKNQQERPVLHRGMHRSIGFESFSSLANNGKLDSETDRSDVLPDDKESQPKLLHTKLVQMGNLAVQPRREQPGSEDVQHSKWNRPLIRGQPSIGSKCHIKQVPLKTEPCSADVRSSEHYKNPLNSQPKNIKIKTDVPEAEVCENTNKGRLQKQIDSTQVIPDRVHNVNYMKSESTSPNMKPSSADVKMFEPGPQHAENIAACARNMSSSVHSHQDEAKAVPGSTSNSFPKCKGFSSASGKSMTFSEEGLHKAKQLFVSVDSDTGITDDSSLHFMDMDSLMGDKEMTGIKEVQNKHEMKLPRRTCTKSQAILSNQGNTTSVESTPESNIVCLNLPAAKESLPGNSVDFEDMLETILKSKSSPEVSRHTPLENMGGSIGGFQTGQDKKFCSKNYNFETAVSMMEDSTVDSNLNTKKLECNSEDCKNTEGSLTTCHTMTTFKGFTTAGGKHLQLSDASLKKASALLNVVDNKPPHTSSSYPEAIKQVKDLFHEGSTEVKNDHSIKDHVNFLTAGEISTKALTVQFVEEDKLPANMGDTSLHNFGKFDCRAVQPNTSVCETNMCVVKCTDTDLEATSSESVVESSNRHLGFSSMGGKGHKPMSNGRFKKGTSLLSREAGSDGEIVQVKESGTSSRVSTVAGKPPQMIDSIMENSRTLLDVDTELYVKEIQNNKDIKSAMDFGIASRKEQDFSDSSLEKQMSLFSEMDKEMNSVSNKMMNERTGLRSIDGERHNKVTGSDLKKSVLLKEGTSKGMKDVLEDNSFNRIDEMTGTAAGKKRKLGDSILKKTTSFVGDVDKDEIETSDGGYSNTAKLAGIGTAGGFGGFSTAGGKKLKLSDASLKKAMSLVADVDVDVTDTAKKVNVGDFSTASESDFSISVTSAGSKSAVFSNACEFGGFSTAGGKKLKLSDASLKKAMSLVADDDVDVTDISKKANVGDSESDFSTSTAGGLGGFSIAGGLEGFSTAGGLGEISTAGGLKGFSTAGGKKLQLSETSMRKAMSIISDVDDADNITLHDGFEKSYSASDGFQTAGGKPLLLIDASVKKGLSVISEIDAEGIKDSVSSDINSESVECQTMRGKPLHINLEEDCTSKETDMLQFLSRPGSSVIKDKGLPPSISRKSSSRFPPGANVPKGFRPFKPPKITKKAHVEKTNDNPCEKVSNKVVETTPNFDISNFVENPSVSSADSCSGEPQTTNFDIVKGSNKDIQQVSRSDKVKPQRASVATDIGTDIAAVLKEGKVEQDIEPSIMDELFSEELESSQHFSPGSGKVLRSQKGNTTPRTTDQGPDVLPSEEYEQFLEIENMALCEVTEIKCEQPLYSESVRSQTSDATNGTCAAQSDNMEVKLLTPVQQDGPVPITTQPPVQQNGFSGFRSATGKNISVSEEAVRKVKHKMVDWPTQAKEEHSEQPTEEHSKQPTEEHSKQPTGNSGFQSASGKKDSISDVALSKTDDYRVSNSEVTKIEDEPVEKCVESEGLKTASGKGSNITDTPFETTQQHVTISSSVFSDESPIVKAAGIANKSSEFGGFQSASSKTVHVSKEALVKAKQSIADWCSEANNESLHGKTGTIQKQGPGQKSFPEFAGFQSASGKKVGVSNEALIKARQSIRDWSSELNIDQSNMMEVPTLGAGDIDSKGDKSSVTPGDVGICEAVSFSGDNIEVTEEEWVVPKLGSFHDMPGKTTKSALVTNSKEEKRGQENSGLCVQADHFSLHEVMNSQYDFSQDESNDHAEGVLREDDNSSLLEIEKTKHHCTGAVQTENSIKSSDLKHAFQSAPGKHVSVSESSFQHARKSIDDIEISSGENMNTSENAIQQARKTMEDVGSSPFQSASGKKVNISENALEYARKTSEDVGSSPFQSASGKKVKVSENALEYARKTLEDVGSSPFQSASGKKVNISENALETARKTLEEVVSSPFQNTSDKKVKLFETAVQHAKGNAKEVENTPFQSASGKKVIISDSALQHARKTVEDINNCPFQSASGNTLTVSLEALKHARKTDTLATVTSGEPKNNVVENSLQIIKSSNSAQSSPFQTATGSKITVSKTSLQLVRQTKEDLESSCVVSEVRNSSLSCDMYPHSVQQTESTTLDKVPRLTYQIIKKVSTVREQQFPPSPCEENFMTPSKQKQYLQKSSKDTGGPRPPQQSTGVSQCVSKSTDRQVFIEGMDHSIDEFCQPDDFLEEMEVTPKRRRVEEKAVSSRSGMVKPMKCVPEAFTRDRQGTSCSLRACHSTSTPTQVTRISVLPSSSKDGSKSQPPVKSSFLTPYKKSDTSMSGTGTNPETSSTASQAPRKPMPRFIPKCLSIHQPDLVKSKTIPSPSFNKETPPENQQETKEKSVKMDIVKLLEGARKHQADLLKDKENTKVNPDPGRLYTVKKGDRRIRMRDVIKLHVHTRHVGKSQHHPRLQIGDARAATAVQHKFYLPDFYTNFQGHVYVGDGAYLVPDDKLYAGKDELFRAFSTLAGVDCRLISDVWFYNHYRWLVWKLAAYEVTSPYNFAGRALTPEVVMLQMKYRYDREVDNCQRSALKKIMERDDTASKRMVLCVSGITQQSQPSQTDIASKQAVRGDTSKQASSSDKLEPQACVELTDGWYSIAARLDVPLTDLVSKHRICVGDKLCLSGAELVGSQDACTPLEAPASLMLKLNANSTRPAPWDARLGYQSDPRPLCISLSGLYGEGGAVGCLDVVLARKYPQMYMEKQSEGGCVFRTGQAEDRFQHQHQRHRQEEMEKLYAKLQTEFELEDAGENCISKKKWTKREVELLQTGHEIYEAYSTSRQPDMIEEYLSDRQRELLMEQRRQVQDEKQQKLHAEFQKTWQATSERTVIPLMKMKFVGCSRKDMDSKASTTVTVWRPTQEVMELSEGTRYKIFGMNASSSRSRYKQCDVQLTASRQTRFMPVTIDENLLDMIYEPREVLCVRDIKCCQPLYGEADFVGMVVSVATMDFAESGRHQEVLYAADSYGSVLGIKFWGGLKSFSLEEVLSEGRLFCASNLMDKSTYRSSVLPLLEASLECSVLTQTSQYPSQRRALDRLKSVATATHGFLETAKEHLSALQQQKKENTKKFTPEKNCKQDMLDPLGAVVKTPVEGTSACSSSTPSAGEGMPPGTSKQVRALHQARMARLLNFGSPTPLSPLVSRISHSVSKDFKPPALRRKSLGPNH